MTEFLQYMTLLSSDGSTFSIDLDAARISGLVTKSLEDDEDDNNPTIQTPNVHSNTLRKIIEFMNIHKTNPPKSIKKSVMGPDFKTVIDAGKTEEYIDFFSEYDEATPEKMDQLYDLMFGADFMEIQPLLELTGAKLGCLAKSKQPGQIHELLVGIAPKA